MADPIEFNPAPVKLDAQFFESLFYPQGWKKASYYQAIQAARMVADAMYAACDCDEEPCKFFLEELAQQIAKSGDMIDAMDRVLKIAREENANAKKIGDLECQRQH